MNDFNNIGLDTERSVELQSKLNELLANYSHFYMNVRGFHWNIQGEEFFTLHAKFEELYNDLMLKIDEIAERILTLEGTPFHAYSEYAKISEVPEVQGVSNGNKAVSSILAALKIVITQQREILNLSGELDDEGTNALMSDYIREQEKLVWMYSAYLR